VYPPVPDVEVRYDFSYTLKLPTATVDHEIDTFASRAAATASAPLRLLRGAAHALTGSAGSDTRPFKVLDGVHGVLRPGTMTLLLSPPGHGKTSLLRALSGRLPPSKLDGSLSYSDVPAADLLRSKGIHLRLLSSYTGQLDEHLPYLTVRETAAFAYENATVDPSLLRGTGAAAGGLLEEEAAHRVDRVLKLLSLNNCADTLVGNDLLRGISGGEKKRVTVAESLVSNARLLCMDE
jgi:ABC-type multidrug transport system ATPase subunit